MPPTTTGDVRIEALEDLRVDRHGVIGPETGLSARGVGIVMAQPDVGRVVVDHRVHGSGRHAEEQPRRAQFGEVAQVVPPVGLGDDCHAIAFGLEQPSDDRRPESRVVDVGIAREEDHIELIPSAIADLLDGCGQKHLLANRVVPETQAFRIRSCVWFCGSIAPPDRGRRRRRCPTGPAGP